MKAEQGMSLVEVMIGVTIFVMGFLPLLKLFSEGGLSQQKIIRDFPVTMSIAERVLMTIENEIDAGRFDVAMFNGGGDEGVDITESVTENREVSMALNNFYGNDNQSAAKYLNKCRVLLSTMPGPEPDLIRICVRFLWNDRQSTSQKFAHNISLFLLKRKE